MRNLIIVFSFLCCFPFFSINAYGAANDNCQKIEPCYADKSNFCACMDRNMLKQCACRLGFENLCSITMIIGFVGQNFHFYCDDDADMDHCLHSLACYVNGGGYEKLESNHLCRKQCST